MKKPFGGIGFFEKSPSTQNQPSLLLYGYLCYKDCDQVQI